MIIGNWKMHKTLAEAESYMETFLQIVEKPVVLAVPFTLLSAMKQWTDGTAVSLAAQDVHFEREGAYTGEISPMMVREFAEYVIIGHSERRKYFAETDDMINKKVLAAQDAGLHVVLCVGETLAQREAKQTLAVIEKQLKIDLQAASADGLTVAYEPVWAIGTGKTATPQQADEVHAFIQKILDDIVGKVEVIYGGSVSPKNAKSILDMPHIDGVLPGGASLDPEKMASIVHLQ